MKGSIPKLIIKQQEFISHCSNVHTLPSPHHGFEWSKVLSKFGPIAGVPQEVEEIQIHNEIPC